MVHWIFPWEQFNIFLCSSAQHCILFGCCTDVIGFNHWKNWRSVGSILGGWCFSGWNSIFPCNHAICRNVWPDGSGFDFHDYRIWSNLQRKYIPCHRHNTAAGHVWYVLWICYIGHLWVRTECNSIGIGFILSNASVEWSHLANRRNAVYIEVIFQLINRIIFRAQ